jgi:hypothetical protein
MKISLFAILFVCSSFFVYCQQEKVFNNQGSYELLPNQKVIYPFNKVNVLNNKIDLYMDNNLVQSLGLLEVDEKLNYKVMQTFPVLSEELMLYGVMTISYVVNENGILHVQVHGTKVSEEHYLKRIY